MAKFQRGTIFETGRTQEGTYTTGIWVSDQLIIEACENGSGHVGRWRTIMANRVKAEASAMAEEGDELNHFWPDRRYQPGCYKNGFAVDRYGGGARHIRRARITNKCEHAIFYETGRDPSGASEWFTTRASSLGAIFGTNSRGKRAYLINQQGTAGFLARPVLGTALKTVAASTNTFGLRTRNLSASAAFNRAFSEFG